MGTFSKFLFDTALFWDAFLVPGMKGIISNQRRRLSGKHAFLLVVVPEKYSFSW
jgi:hypothetical protein